jgi:hypothetical protein
MRSIFFVLCALSLCINIQCTTTAPISQTTEVLVIGGGASGTTAAIQAARSGAQVLLVAENEWLGGMLTAAGVSATDGNHRLPSGLWGEFRQKLYDHYGGPDSVFTGWVSNTQFEPSVGNRFWQEMVAAEPNLTRWTGYRVVEVLKKDKRILGATFENGAGEIKSVAADITIEATELGDVLALAGANYTTGQDSPGNPHDDNIQDLTYAAILRDFGKGTDKTIANPPDYDPAEFECFCREACHTAFDSIMDCQTVLNYGRLPNDKFMINWPNDGNDYYVNPIPMSYQARDSVYQLAKERTLAFVHYLQTEAGFPHYGLAEDEFPTADNLPLIPYHREARRVEGLVQLRVDDLIDPYADPERPFYRSAIAVGDYPLDHHHDKNPNAQAEEYPPIPSFSVPYECLVPKGLDGLLVVEKSISVNHMVNGATRLQPCVLLIGQAAGAAAALCVQNQQQPQELSVKSLQEELLEANCWLMPFIDVSPDDPDFASIQRVGVQGLLRGTGIPYKWANQTWFYPDSAITVEDFWAAFPVAVSQEIKNSFSGDEIRTGQAMELIWQAYQQSNKDPDSQGDGRSFFAQNNWLPENDDLTIPLSRRQMAYWMDVIW